MKILHHRPFLYGELVALTIGIPVLLYLALPMAYLLPIIWLTALYCQIIYRAMVDASQRIFWRREAVNLANLKPLLARFALSALLLFAITWYLRPELLWSFVSTRPAFWALVMVGYPLLSVVPQEIIFRSFFFTRYRELFHTRWAMIAASGIMFGAAHIIFQNWVAPILCLIGGLLFAHTYDKHRSLLLVSIEHALYGCFLFTLGLGRYFYHGAVQ